MLQRLLLQHFRNYSQKKIDFSDRITVIVGQNTAGKTNMVEALMLLASGKSKRAEHDTDMISFGKEVARVQGLIASEQETIKLEVTLAQGTTAGGRYVKRFAVNDIPKSRNHFVGYLPTVLFNPEALEIIIDGPGVRREFLNDVLESVDIDYRQAKTQYEKALRQRNALLTIAQESGIRNEDQFSYWDQILITNGQLITAKREAFITFVNTATKPLFEFTVIYDKSVMSEERLLQYQTAELGAGITLVGPQRDDFYIEVSDATGEARNIGQFGSRGQQRLVVLQLKLLHMEYIEQQIRIHPLLVLDDIFSELDDRHISLVLEKVTGRQVIITTTHKEFVKDIGDIASMIELEKPYATV